MELITGLNNKDFKAPGNIAMDIIIHAKFLSVKFMPVIII